MIHRAPFGSMERFIGVLIEHFAGAFPAVAQPRAGARAADQREVQRLRGEVCDDAEGAGIRATMDEPNERVQARSRHGRS
jgi:threonyl-tRNA synthetase